MMLTVLGAPIKSLSGVGADRTGESPTEKTDQGKGDGVVTQLNKTMLVISGGEGYIDFRLGNGIDFYRYEQRC